VQTVESLPSQGQALKVLMRDAPQLLEDWMENTVLIDNQRPADPGNLSDQSVPEKTGGAGKLRLIGGVVLLLILLALAAAWQWTPLKSWLDLNEIAKIAVSVRENPLAPVIVVGGFVIGGLVSFPATILIVATAITFGPLTGFIYNLTGCVSSAVCCYGVGRMLGREAVQRFAGERINRLSRQLANRGLLAILIIRLAPVAPFTVMNLAAGASHIKFWDFTLGTIFGMAPGLFAMTLFGDSLEDAIRHPGPKTFAFMTGLILSIVIVNLIFRKWLAKRDNSSVPQ